MYIEEIKSGDTVQLNVEGKIDSITSPEFQEALLKSFQKGNQVVVNMEKVVYISSAALRAFTLGQKTAQSKGGRMTITNAPQSVMDVFKTTGFDKFLNIS